MDDISDGEIRDEIFSDISEEEYFDNIASKIEKRKLELELLNEIVACDDDDYPKENRQNVAQVGGTSSRKSSHNSIRKESHRRNEARNRSYRASSVISASSYAFPKVRKRPRRRRRKYTRNPSPVVSLNSSEELVVEVIPNETPQESDEDEELLALRLKALSSALTSKQEVKEPIEEPEPEQVPSPAVNTLPHSNEEEQLRIDALRSAVLKKRDHIRKRKQQRMLENERPYSPSDKFEPIFDAAIDSPLGSPFQPEPLFCDIINNEHVDMDISSGEALEDSSNQDTPLQLQPTVIMSVDDDLEENEDELRSMLLSSINKKKREKSPEIEIDIENNRPPALLAKNLKKAVERLKQRHPKVPLIVSQKSGKKTIKMILEEQKNKKLNRDVAHSSQSDVMPGLKEETLRIEDDENNSNVSNGALTEIVNNTATVAQQLEQSEEFLIDKISSNQVIQPVPPVDLPVDNRTIEIADSSFSTITDTKNIPILAATKKIDKRLVTTLDSVIRPVTPLVISLREESSDDEYDTQAKKSKTRLTKQQKDFEKSLDSFLKDIRLRQEKTETSKTSIGLKPTKSQFASSKSLSAVKHLPLSSQVEYQNLVNKMKILQEAKQQRERAGTLKRTKSTSSTTEMATSKKQTKPPEKKTAAAKEKSTMSKIDETIAKIPLLDEAARVRLIEKTEKNFLNHSKNLLDSTESSLKLLQENSAELKKREKIENKIEEIEKTLIKYKSLLRVVNSRIKVNTPKILQSQRKMIQLRSHQRNFGHICRKVGENVRGTSYELPDHGASKIESNFSEISEKAEEIHKAITDQPYASNQLKLMSETIKEFIPKPSTQQQKEQSEPKETNTASAITSELPTNENQQSPEKNEQEHPIIHRHVKRSLEASSENSGGEVIAKKAKNYESPLDFLKLPSTFAGNRKSVNQIVCPFSMEGMCKDERCEYLHL